MRRLKQTVATMSTVMPTDQTVPNYSVSVIGVSYLYKWQ